MCSLTRGADDGSPDDEITMGETDLVEETVRGPPTIAVFDDEVPTAGNAAGESHPPA